MIKPLYDRVLLEKVEVKAQTESGILLPESSKEQPNLAKVIAVGEGKRTKDGTLIPMGVKVNDTVIYKQFAASDVKYEQKDYLIVEMKDILAVVEEDV
ncbi:molecular chaperone GroES [Erysipelothrix larvae]|uniref:Co-chaperonin GroES n=1 Tax=Erysipelothrix larvae TaxID=1514105 RepID=A0A0X8H1D4_9FIRM|nr:co-chaperone GroES [Erysipelothrix larvae]AMC94267.1 molecular chaperone GroES [Erysipelothrix larvae]